MLNKGSNPAALPTDQRGVSFVRAFGGQADIGAVEDQPPSITDISTSTTSPTNATSLTFTVALNQPVSGLSPINFQLTTSPA